VRRLARCVAVAAALAAAGTTAGEMPPSGLAFVHVEANVGGASGGHLALRVDRRVYNFQFQTDGGRAGAGAGLLVLMREDWDRVLFRYSTLENRPLHVASIPLPDADLARIRDYFDRFYLDQQRALDELRAARDDVDHLETLARGRATVRLRGAGLLDPGRRGAPAAAALRERIAERLGPAFLTAAAERAAAGREALALPLGDVGIEPERLRRARELLAEQTALAALGEGWDLAPGAWFADPDDRPLAPEQRARLEAFGVALEERVLALLDSPRPDRGFALLLATARRLAVARSLDEGRLVLLDPLPDGGPTVSPEEVGRHREELAAAVRLAERAWPEERRALLVDPLDEIAYNQLEERAARYRELRDALTSQGGLRLAGGPLIPSRARRVAVGSAGVSREALADALAQARARRDRLRATLAERYGYDLISDNCVHALAAGLSQALGGDAALRAALGIDRDPERALGFIPRVFFAQARAGVPDGQVERIASYRERALEALYRSGRPAAVYLRESNQLTSTLYRHRDEDGSFLFFTSDVVWPRPLYGLANVLWAFGDGVVGMATAPFDRGRRLERAAQGVLFSAPELVFENIRKGSFDAAGLERQR